MSLPFGADDFRPDLHRRDTSAATSIQTTQTDTRQSTESERAAYPIFNLSRLLADSTTAAGATQLNDLANTVHPPVDSDGSTRNLIPVGVMHHLPNISGSTVVGEYGSADKDLEKDEDGSSPGLADDTVTQLPSAAGRPSKRYCSIVDSIRRRSASVWALTNRETIPTGTEDTTALPKPTTSGTPLPPANTSGMFEFHEYMFVGAVCLAQLFSLAGLSQSIAPLLIIAESFGISNPGEMAWFTASYSMTLGTFILPAGRLGDMFGHKRMFLIGWIWFAFWSVIAGFSYAGGAVMLSTCRGLQGIGPALLVPNGIALIGRTFPIGIKRAYAIAVFGGCGPVGFMFGVVFSALFAQLLWWPWAFWAMAFGCVFSLAIAWVTIPPDTFRLTPTDPAGARQREGFDMFGAVTGVSGLILINFALNQAPVVGWNVAYIPVLLVLGFLLMGAFVYVELHLAVNPIVSLKGLHRDAAFTLGCIAAGWGSHGIWNYYLFLFIIAVRGQSPLKAAAQTWPVAPIGFCAALAVPWLLRKMRVPYLMTIAMAVFGLSILFLIFAPVDQTYFANTMLSVLIAPLAMNWSFPSGTILMSNAVSKQHQGIAASLTSTMVNYSIATGLGLAGSIDRYVGPAHGVVEGMRAAWWFGVSLGLLGVVISLYFVWQSRKPAK